MFILFHHDNVVGGFGRWLCWHFKERGVFMEGNCQAHALNKYRAFETCTYLRGELVAGVQMSSVV